MPTWKFVSRDFYFLKALCGVPHKCFKWIKQHLKIKSFWGQSENAVKTQIYCAIITYCLISIMGKDLNIDRSIYEILQILGISLLDKTPIKEMLTKMLMSDIITCCYSAKLNATLVPLNRK